MQELVLKSVAGSIDVGAWLFSGSRGRQCRFWQESVPTTWLFRFKSPACHIQGSMLCGAPVCRQGTGALHLLLHGDATAKVSGVGQA
jgi:hypothetical protein